MVEECFLFQHYQMKSEQVKNVEQFSSMT